MKASVLLSKIVAIPGESTWSQVYSTLNLYVVLSIKSETTKSITATGKELLEKIQREYFSLDEKTLENIKKSIESAVSEIEDKNSISVVLATIKENVLYIVIASNGSVMLKRGEKIGPIAEEHGGQISAFSGKLLPSDVVVIETADFAEKVPVDKLSSAIDNHEVAEISENLAPIVHDSSKGTEAAIILKIPGGDGMVAAAEPKGKEEEGGTTEGEEGTLDNDHLDLGGGRKSFISLPKTRIFQNFKVANKKTLIIAVIVILAIILVGSVILERASQESKKRQAILNEILASQESKFEEATALMELNKGLALDEFKKIKETVERDQTKLAQGTAERKKLDEFVGRVEEKIGELESGSTVANQKTIFEKGGFVQFKEGLVGIDQKSGKIFLLSEDGSVEDEIESKNENVAALAASDKFVFVLGDAGISRTSKSAKSTSVIVEEAQGTVAIDIFGSNVYGLDAQEKTVDKYSGSSYGRSDYFTEDVKLSDPKSMAIDASIWIIDGALPAGRQGKVRKFTRGKEDSFNVSGLANDISSDSQIFTSIDYSNVYVLDAQAGRIIAIGKSDGAVKNQYVWANLSRATSFAIDEENKKAYVGADNKIYSFDL